jgi:peptidoglycan-N-acetylglucosamine deacetylase
MRLRRRVRAGLEVLFARPPASRLLTWRGRRVDRRIAVTFDDGPVPGFTEEVLAILAAAGARATFFVLGERAERHPALIRRIVDGGHEVGVHGWDHTSSDLPAQVRRTAALLDDLGAATRLFRPPRGHLPLGAIPALVAGGWRTVFWSFDTSDSMRHEGKRDVAIDYNNVSGGDIVLLHDDNPVCVGELPDLLAAAAASGLTPVRVGDLVG